MFDKKPKQEDSEKPSAKICRIPSIYVMPERFLSAAAQTIKLKKKKKKDKGKSKDRSRSPIHQAPKKRLIHPAILGLVILIVGVLGVAVVYLLTSKPEPQIIVKNTNQAPKNTNQTPKNSNQPPKNINQQPVSVCGDGKVDHSKNEQCDDGNTISGDGCSSDCRKEAPKVLDAVKFTSYAATTDSDEDFLTDTEENLYGTGVNNMDEDGDTYIDGLEVINLYSPKSKQSTKLSDSDMVHIFNNQEQGYSIFYPQGWTVRYLSEDKSSVNFVSSTVEFIQMLVTDNSSRKSITNWAKEQFFEYDVSKLERIGVGDKLGIRSPDGLTVYFTNEDKIYSLTYQISTLRRLNFKATFQMMYNSLKLYSRGDEEGPVPDQWSTYTNNQLNIKLQHPINLEAVVSENNVIKIDDFSLQLMDNTDAIELNEWFWQKYSQEENENCELRSSELRIGSLETFLIDKPIESDDAAVCQDSDYYAISSDKKRVIKLTIGNNPVREMAQILGTLVLVD